MKTKLTPFVLSFLIQRGYKFLLSKTEVIQNDDNDVLVILTPVIARPAIRKIPRGYDTYFNIRKEPAAMANGVDRTLFLVNLNGSDINCLKEMIIKEKKEVKRLNLYAINKENSA